MKYKNTKSNWKEVYRDEWSSFVLNALKNKPNHATEPDKDTLMHVDEEGKEVGLVVYGPTNDLNDKKYFINPDYFI